MEKIFRSNLEILGVPLRWCGLWGEVRREMHPINPPSKYRCTCTVIGQPFPRLGGGTSIWAEASPLFFRLRYGLTLGRLPPTKQMAQGLSPPIWCYTCPRIKPDPFLTDLNLRTPKRQIKVTMPELFNRFCMGCPVIWRSASSGSGCTSIRDMYL